MSLLLTRYWKSLARIVSFTRDVDLGKPLPHSVEPWAGFSTYARRVGWGNPQPRSLEYHVERNPYIGYVIQLHDSFNNAESSTNSFNGQGHHGLYQNPSQQEIFSWKLGASQNLGPSFPLNPSQPKLPFLETLHFLDLSRLLNDLICHDPRCPPMLTMFPS
jgi:hypothetical protein